MKLLARISLIAFALASAPLCAQVVQVPYRPIPPAGADYAMAIPRVGADGVRATLNKNLGADETLWHVRSGWNVAALNCLEPRYEPILAGYKQFLKRYAAKLTATNAALEAQYRNIAARERANTQVYNYFALPMARQGFCDAALALSGEFIAAPPADAAKLAAVALPRLDAPFEQFFAEYDQYLRDAAAWDAAYGAQFGYSQPGYVAAHRYGGVPAVTAVAEVATFGAAAR